MAGGRIATRPPPAALSSVARDGSAAALVHGDGSMCVYELRGGAGAAGAVAVATPAQRNLGSLPASLVVCAGKRGRGRVVAFADRHGRVFRDVPVEAGKAKKGGVQVCAMEEGGAVLVAVGGDGRLLAAAGGGRKELVVVVGGGEGVGKGDEGEGEVRRFALVGEFVAGITAVGVSPGGESVVVCGQAVVLVDAGTGVVVTRYQGHASPVTACAFLPAERRADGAAAAAAMFVTACAGDQFLSVWEVTGGGGGGKDGSAKKKRRMEREKVGALHTFVAPEKGARGVVVDCGGGEETGTVSVAAVMPSGCIAVWTAWAPKKAAAAAAAVTTPATFTVRCADEDAVLFVAFAKAGVLTVAHGHPLRPAFYDVELLAVDGECVHVPAANVKGLLVADAGMETGGVTGKERIAAAERTVAVGVKEAPAMSADKGKMAKVTEDGRVLLANGGGEGEGADDEDIGNAEGDTQNSESEDGQRAEGQAGKGADDAEEGDDEPTLRDKLASMGVEPPPSDRRKGYGRGGGDARADGDAVDSIGNVLAQAVRTKDDKLFDSVVGSTSKPATIQSTISRLPYSLATGDCLNMFVTRLIERPSRAASLMPWVKHILMEHAGALASQGRSPVIDRLRSAITARVETLPALTRLEGRLELVVAQADRVRAARQSSVSRLVPAVEYVERAKVITAGEESDDGELEQGAEQDVLDDDESSGSDSGDADETGDFSESSEDEDSTSSSEAEEEDGQEEGSNLSLANGKVAKNVEDLMDMSASESES